MQLLIQTLTKYPFNHENQYFHTFSKQRINNSTQNQKPKIRKKTGVLNR